MGRYYMPKFYRYIAVSVAAILLLFVSVSNAYAQTVSKRITGNDRFKTAVAVSNEGWPDGAEYVVLATAEDYPDALSAAPLAAKYDAPILLTDKNTINSDTTAEISRLKAKNIIIVGGVGVISQDVEDRLKSADGFTVTRIAGSDRYDTAVKVAEKLGDVNNIAVVTGSDFADAISMAPIAAKLKMPILLTEKDKVPQSVKNYLDGRKIDKTYVVGSFNEISQYAENALPNTVRISGDDKYQRNINVIKLFNNGLDLDTVYAATGENYPDALAASVLASKGSHPVIIVGKSVSPSLKYFLSSNAVNNITILGGAGAVSHEIESELTGMPQTIVSAENITATVMENDKYELPQNVTVKLSNYVNIQVPVIWNNTAVDTGKAGRFVYEGTVKGYSGKVQLVLNVKPSVVSVNDLYDETVKGANYNFPAYAVANYSDGTTGDYPVTWMTNYISIANTGTYIFQGNLSGSTMKVFLTLNVVPDEEVNVKDDVLREIILRQLGKPQSYTLHKSDVLNITSIADNGTQQIKTLSGLENFKNLETLELKSRGIDNISYLQGLTNLKRLVLSGNEISDVSNLQGKSRLEYLDLSGNRISNISPLKDLKNLEYLYLKDNINGGVKLTDFSPLNGLMNSLRGRDF
jgi:putative cell wall-binding protein